MRFLHRELHSLTDVQRNFEQLEPLVPYRGTGAPAFVPSEGVTLYFRTDKPTVANQRIYIWTGSAWSGIV